LHKTTGFAMAVINDCINTYVKLLIKLAICISSSWFMISDRFGQVWVVRNLFLVLLCWICHKRDASTRLYVLLSSMFEDEPVQKQLKMKETRKNPYVFANVSIYKLLHAENIGWKVWNVYGVVNNVN
jgi:hypothetical protein